MSDFLDELALEELTPTETREILLRLAVEEFGGPDRPRVSDLAEATGAPIEVVIRLLADIRNARLEDWKDDIGARIRRQNSHLAELQEQSNLDEIGNVYRQRERLRQAMGGFQPIIPSDLKRFIVIILLVVVAGIVFMSSARR